jgi:photosystem II stability/assembly factor-like uncharacterized protein
LAAFVFSAAPASGAEVPSDRYPDEFLQDAELCDVCFVDPDRGWAVGDRGVIWHTEDGGRHWHLQQSQVSCRFESVCFLDDRHGWIVGGWTHPYTHKTSGVVLRTFDGGQRWEQVPRLSLPGLKRVKFLDARRGWALGQVSAIYPAGVFHTEDGGLSWSSVPSGHTSRWLTGDFFAAEAGAAGGSPGGLSSVCLSGLEAARAPDVAARVVRRLRFSADHRAASQGARSPVPFPARAGWSVGDGGLVLLSVDGGRSWHEPLGRLPAETRQFDFRALAVRGDSCWIAGSPGSRVFHTSNSGHTWRTFETGQPLPLRAMTFLDANRGWAVGSLGTILATRDGGQSWTIQRQGGGRAALLAVFSEPRSIPLEMLALLAADEGYRSTVEIVGHTPADLAVTDKASPSERAHEAVVAVGASQAETAWRYPLRYGGLAISAQTIVEDWSRINGQPGRDLLVEHLVRKIRLWRPEIVVTEPASLPEDDPLDYLVNQAVLAAVEKAADPSAYADQIAWAGLTAWKVKKTFSSLGGDVGGTVNLTTSQLAPRLARSLTDQARRGRQLLHRRHHSPPQTYGFELLVNQLPQQIGRRDFFSGITVPIGGDARRIPHTPPPGDPRTLSRLARQRRNLDQLLRHLADSAADKTAWVSQIADLTRGLDPASSGEVLWELAENLQDSGRADLAADVHELMVRQYPHHALRGAALTWLVQFHASSEARWGLLSPRRAASPPRSDRRPASGEDSTGAVRPAGFLAPVEASLESRTVSGSASDAGQRAAQYAQLLQSCWPSMFSAPEVRFPLAVADRTAGRTRDAESYFHALSAGRPQDPWSSCAWSELWLLRPSRRAPKPSIRCGKPGRRPRLDGELQDAAWKECPAIPLTSPFGDDARWPASVLLAYDDEFLFVAASCRKAPGAEYPASDSPRPRDPDLSQRDRIQLLIDVDRDYTTYYHLTIDHRGWAGESCLDVTAWDPDWYIAAVEDEQSWTVEAAIPWSALAENPPTEQSVWAIGLQRVVPRVGFQAWSRPASPQVRPEGFGLLMFQ